MDIKECWEGCSLDRETEAQGNKFGRLVHRVGSIDLRNAQYFHEKHKVLTLMSGVLTS